MRKYNRIHYKLSRAALIMFVGINPHPGSYERGVPFSNNKMFWYILSKAHLIKEPVEELKDDPNLRKIYENKFSQAYKLNFINLVDRPTISVSELEKGEEQKGIKRVKDAILAYKPMLVCFVGKITYEKFIGVRNTDYGFKEPIFGTKTYVCRFPIRGPSQVRVREMEKLLLIARNEEAKHQSSS